MEGSDVFGRLSTGLAFVRNPAIARRVVLVVLDGLRPDAIPTFSLDTIRALALSGAFTSSATTVSPSVTAACMASVMCGVNPDRHGVTSTRFHIPRQKEPVYPMPELLRSAGMPTSSFMGEVPFLCRGIAKRIAKRVGIGRATFRGRDSTTVLAAARDTLRTQLEGLVVLHWPEVDAAGHAHGWMSDAYAGAATTMDRSLADLAGIIDVNACSDTLLIALADHGGGGAIETDHDSDHPLDRTIPILLAGAGIEPGTMLPGASLLDVPATVLRALGVEQPASYDGRPLVESAAEVALAAV